MCVCVRVTNVKQNLSSFLLPLSSVANHVQPFLGGQCARNAPVAFLRDLKVECLAACQDGGGMIVAINSGTGGTSRLTGECAGAG